MSHLTPIKSHNNSVAKITDFKGLHEGKRVFILASGVSLKDLDLTPLKRRMVIGLNRSALLYPDTHYHCTMDRRLFDLYPEELKETRYLFTLEGNPWGVGLNLLGAEGFSRDLEEGIYSGYTVAYFALQLAVYMGFKEIYYLGLDLGHHSGNTHFFGYDFHSRGHEEIEFPRMRRMLTFAAELLAKTDVDVYNCSPESTLNCFPKVSYEHAISL